MKYSLLALFSSCALSLCSNANIVELKWCVANNSSVPLFDIKFNYMFPVSAEQVVPVEMGSVAQVDKGITRCVTFEYPLQLATQNKIEGKSNADIIVKATIFHVDFQNKGYISPINCPDIVVSTTNKTISVTGTAEPGAKFGCEVTSPD